jgi:transposase
LFLLSERHLARITPYFPRSHGVPLGNDRRVIRRIICVIRNGRQLKDRAKAFGKHKTFPVGPARKMR